MIHGYTYSRKNWVSVIFAKLDRAEKIFNSFPIGIMFFGSCVEKNLSMNMKIFHYLVAKKPFLWSAKNDLRSTTTKEELQRIFPHVKSGDRLFIVSDICHIGRCITIAWKLAQEQGKKIEIFACPSDIPYLTGLDDPLSRDPDNFFFINPP